MNTSNMHTTTTTTKRPLINHSEQLTLLGESLSVAHYFLGFVTHLPCATYMKPHITFIRGARLSAPRIDVMTVAHCSTCATDSAYGARRFGAPRIGCVTDIKNGAPQICLPFYFFSKIQQKYTIYSRKYTVYSRNLKVYISNTGIHRN
jgi:hypothetical protein